VGYFPSYFRQAKEHNTKLLHAHFGPKGIDALALAQALHVPLVTSFYGSDMSKHQGELAKLGAQYAQLFDQGTLFLVEGPAAQATLISLGCPPHKVRIQRLGIDVESFPYAPRETAADAPIYVLSAATFTEKKGMAYGIEAFCQAASEDPRLRLTVVGDARAIHPEEAIIKKQLYELVAKYRMDGRVHFVGMVPLEQLRQLGYTHQIFLHPSVTAASGDAEGGSPVVITQMAALGMPIVATRHCDIPQVVLDGETGLLADERNVTQLRQALLVLAADGDLRREMGIRGRKHIKAHFDARQQGQRLAEIYREVMRHS